MEQEVTAMQALITNIEPMVTQVFTMVSTVATKIVETPLLLASFGFFLVGGAVGIFRRMLSA